MSDRRTVFILGGSSDIGVELARRYLAAEHRVALTYRSSRLPEDLIRHPNFLMLPCDVLFPDEVSRTTSMFSEADWRWDQFISCVGTTRPIGPFFETEFSSWAQSIHANAIGQLHALHSLYPFRRPGKEVGAMFMAGGGTNGPMANYSAYAASKIFLIKMAELLDDEALDLNVSVIGPGYVRTKIHGQTLANPEAAGKHYRKMLDFLKTDGTSHDDIFACIEWLFGLGKGLASGRNFSVVHDGWRDGGYGLVERLARDPNMYKLRRNGN